MRPCRVCARLKVAYSTAAGVSLKSSINGINASRTDFSFTQRNRESSFVLVY